MERYVVGFLKLVVDEAIDDGGLADVLVSQQHQLVLDFAANGHGRDAHQSCDPELLNAL